jgi:thiamine-monophosphate kinase
VAQDTVSEVGEHELIARITRRLSQPTWVVVGPGDDAAVVEPARGELDVFTTDALVDGVHFDRSLMDGTAVGHRALAVNLSDLAAMGARPRAALWSLALPAALPMATFEAIVAGFTGLAESNHVALLGGNITRTPGPLHIDVTAIGSVRRRRALTRAGARPGDEVYVTGSLGDAAVGLRALRAQMTASGAGAAEGHGGHDPLTLAVTGCMERYLRPDARTRAGEQLGLNRAASSCMDLSDGLADGVRQIAAASDVGITIDATALPITDEVRRWHAHHGGDPVDTAFSGGDDYELIFTVRPRQRGRLRAARRHLGDLPITRIGVVTRARDLLVTGAHGSREIPAGYEHFR